MTKRLLALIVCRWTCWICGNTYSNDQRCPYCN